MSVSGVAIRFALDAGVWNPGDYGVCCSGEQRAYFADEEACASGSTPSMISVGGNGNRNNAHL